MGKHTHHTGGKPRRGPKGGKAHKVWAAKRMNRPERDAAMERGHAKLMRFFGA